LLYKVKNICKGSLTLNFLNRVMSQGEVFILEFDAVPYELQSLSSYRLITIEEIIDTSGNAEPIKAPINQEIKNKKIKNTFQGGN